MSPESPMLRRAPMSSLGMDQNGSRNIGPKLFLAEKFVDPKKQIIVINQDINEHRYGYQIRHSWAT
ncbi:MAG: hypothetical protein P8H53_06365, partial [Paracoccaceae bacterium]|nr:hypothetical protein [Paracoccaceae bacterium]